MYSAFHCIGEKLKEYAKTFNRLYFLSQLVECKQYIWKSLQINTYIVVCDMRIVYV